MSTNTVAVEGLRELRSFAQRIDKAAGEPTLLPGYRSALKEAAEPVAVEARKRAPRSKLPLGKGRSPRKRLHESITINMAGSDALIRAGGLRRGPKWPQGYRFPRRVEYEGSGGQRAGYGPRAFLGPALEAKADEVREAMGGVLDALESEWGSNRG